MSNLVVVESPAKAKTIKKYLGSDFQILASYGHVRDLVPKEGAVDPEHDFAMRYELIEKNIPHVEAISKALKKADALYLATDPDREGEAISWHICEILRQKKVLKDKPVHRIVFHQITKTAIKEAIAHPREISQDLVNAQQARRALDYLVGFNLSPLLWRKIRPGLSAGRVQSPALRMIVEREEEIEKFVAQEYWTIEADLARHKQKFNARLIEYQNEKLEQFSITNTEQAQAIEQALQKATQGKIAVVKVERKQRKRQPAAPFITSTLQQEASRKLGFTAQRTMRIAQQLYEGVDVAGETVGLITYMRTDSVTLANDAITEIRAYIKERYGADYLPEAPRVYVTKTKNAQEAHEAIRPTSVHNTSEAVKKFITADQFKLYQLIWKRTVACQMEHALLDTVAVDFSNDPQQHRFRANGSTITHPGFMAVYQEGNDDHKKTDDDEAMLPPLEVGDVVKVQTIMGVQHFTEPPPRYSEASLVKALEEYGIGRPSTYASIISTLVARKYVNLEQRRFTPTDVGRIVSHFLTQYFTQYVDYDFTAKLEDELDDVSRGEKAWIPLLDAFWGPFKHLIEDIAVSVKRKDVTQEMIDEKCPKCGKPLSIRLGRSGRFIGCTGYPECDYTRNLNESPDAPSEAEIIGDRKCPDCGSALVIKHGRYGRFIGCSGYPNCKFIEPLEKPKDTGILCPQCKEGHLLERKSRFGKLFYSCSTYPKCTYAVWYPPLDEPCPNCGWPILTLKTTKRYGTEKVCPRKECGFKAPVEE
ncbi:MAG: type I DNA topoisomerase [Gammaproteobacteria bacterium]